MGVASAVGMQELSRTPQEYIAAIAEKIRELGLKTPTLKFQNGDVQNLNFSVMDKLHKPVVAIGSCCSLKAKVVLSLNMCARSTGNESLNEMEFTCPRVGSSCKLHKSGKHPGTRRAQTTGRFTRKSSHQCRCARRGKWSCECRRDWSNECWRGCGSGGRRVQACSCS